jgi:hypothetical protein
LAHAGRTLRAKVLFELNQANLIPAEDGFFRRGILQASQLAGQRRRGRGRQTVDHPLATALGRDKAAAAQVGQMPRDLHLRFAQNLLQMADTKWSIEQEIHDAQPRPVAEAFMDAEEIHGRLLYVAKRIYARGIVLAVAIDGTPRHALLECGGLTPLFFCSAPLVVFDNLAGEK